MSRLYCITCRATGKIYIGITSAALSARWKQHLRDAKRHDNKFYRAIKKYGPSQFDMSELHVYGSWDEACHAEVALIDALDLLKSGYNSALGGNLPPMWSPIVRANYSKAKTGLKRPPRSQEHCDNLSAALKGRVFSSETREKMAAAKRGRKQSPEHIAKCATAHRGRIVSEETRRKISKAQCGIPRGPRSTEVREKIAASWRRRLENEALYVYS